VSESLQKQTIRLEDALALWYSDLRQIAVRLLRRERRDHTLRPTDLTHNVMYDLLEHERREFNDRVHLFSYFAVASQNKLKDHARKRAAEKRGGDQTRVSMSELNTYRSEDRIEERIEIQLAVEKLRRHDPEAAEVFRLFEDVGAPQAEIAAQFERSDRWVRDELKYARAWLLRELDPARV